MEEYLAAEGVSGTNQKRTMRAVRSLVRGDGVPFPKAAKPPLAAGRPLRLSDDLVQLLAEAREWCPAEEDKSRGWLYAHPLKKLMLFKRERGASWLGMPLAPPLSMLAEDMSSDDEEDEGEDEEEGRPLAARLPLGPKDGAGPAAAPGPHPPPRVRSVFAEFAYNP
ncbi:hypothetical protein EMIHUDRAFT_221040 [Emiliania huxleyi CCMP1516]|uniref:Uncharacterized protein n=2 Tax=Emiliania huxleyi TaxID=2903 RepID=A0A0D3HZW0_EMIH1|nr:hypothetical protein EMIHUDRAFT_221040 [Emiliania huxleyi CCMP1516]EOD04545.1 hypothetical protein EMIHUDRAFT_221040 [Emiliania huxleyi CCMP1516]|eukprot:XP_005756974.1 hypothetical protein EMIHUDRAFT_221040 [Emiliania huxleyi CCMP1516]